MKYAVKVITGPEIEPVTLVEALAHCHADSSVEDTWFNLAIQAAREKTEDYLRRALIEQILEVSFNGFPGIPIQLPRSPVVSVTSLLYYGTDDTEYTFTLTDLLMDLTSDPARISLDYGITWPSTTLRNINSVIIRYTAGYGDEAADVPAKVRMAILFLIGYWYENRAIDFPDPPATFYNLLRPDRLYIKGDDE